MFRRRTLGKKRSSLRTAAYSRIEQLEARQLLAVAAFEHTQTDATTGSGTITATIDASSEGGPSNLVVTAATPMPTLNQKDTTTQPVPAGAVGFMTDVLIDQPGSPNGVHLDWNQGDPSAVVTLSAEDNGVLYEIDVPLILVQGGGYSYAVDVFDNNSSAGGTNDATGSNRFAGWIGDDGDGHRHSGDTHNFQTGPDTFVTDANGGLGNLADGDTVGFTSSKRDGNGALVFIDTINVTFDLNTDDATLRSIPITDAPVIQNVDGDTLLFAPGAAAQVVDQGGDAAVVDSNSPDFDGGVLTTSIASGGANGEDQLVVRNQGTGGGQIGVSGSDVTFEGTTIGTFSGGTGGTDLTITLNGNADQTATSALLQNIAFANSAGAAATQGMRTVEVTLDDGDGEVSDLVTATVNVTTPSVWTWDGDSDSDGDGTDWFDPENWDVGTVPESPGTVIFADADVGTVDLGGGTGAAGQIQFTNTGGSFDITGGTLAINGDIAQSGDADNTISAEVLLAPTVITTERFALLDVGNTGQRVEPGAIGLSANGDNQNNNNFPGLTSDTGATFDVSITNVDQSGAGVDNLDFRDRGDSANTDPLVQIGEDFVKNNLGIVTVTLSGLPAGQYNVTSYHLDPDFDQSDQIVVDVMVDAGGGFISTGAAGNSDVLIGGVDNLTTANVQATSANFSFTANGTDDVVIVFDGSPSGDLEAPLNGLELLSELDTPTPTTTVDASINVIAGSLNITGSVTAAASATDSTITFEGGGDLIIDGAVSGPAGTNLVKDGTGSASLNAANSFDGTVAVNGGELAVGANDALGTTSAGTTVAAGATLTFDGTFDYSSAEPLDLAGTLNNRNGNTEFTGDIILTAAGLQAEDGELTLSGELSGTDANAFVKTGAGTVTLSSANTFTGAISVEEGELVTAADGALGTADAGVNVTGGATLSFEGAFDYTTAESLTLAGTLNNRSGDTQFDGAINYAGGSIGSQADTLTVSSDLDLGISTLLLTGAGNVVLAGDISNGLDASFMPGFYTIDGQAVVEGENFTNRTADADGTRWAVAPAEIVATDNAVAFSNARGGSYVQLVPDTPPDDGTQGGGGPLVDPSIEYAINISTPGTYRMYLRWDGDEPTGNADSMFADIIELKDGNGGAIPDHYEFQQNIDQDFATSPWDGQAGAEVDNGGGTPKQDATWDISAADISANNGVFTVRFTERENGAAVDAFVLQLDSLPAPTGNGPAETFIGSADALSAIVKEGSGTATLAGNNSFGGQVEINTGTLTAASDNALGVTDAGTNVASGATLGFSGGVDIGSENVTISGAGAAGNGALLNLDGENTFGGEVTLAEDAATIPPGPYILTATTTNSTDPAAGAIVNSPPGLQEDVEAFVDRTHEWNGADASGIPPVLLGADYIQTANDDRTAAGFTLDMTFSTTVDVYVWIDNRTSDIAGDMPWVANLGFVDTGLTMGIDEGGDGAGPGDDIEQTFSIYVLENVSGSLQIGQGPQEGINMYGVGVVPSPVAADSGAATIGAAGGELTITGDIDIDLGTSTLTFDGEGNVVVDGTILGTQSNDVVKQGAGAVIFNSANTYTGGTTISGGALVASNTTGSATGSGNVTVVGNNATLAGDGTISGSVMANMNAQGSFIDVGTDLGVNPVAATLTTGPLTVTGGSLMFDITGSGPSTNDTLAVNGNVVLSGRLFLFPADDINLVHNDTFTLIDNDGADLISGVLFDSDTSPAVMLNQGDRFEVAQTVSGSTVLREFEIDYQGGDGNDLVVTVINRAPIITVADVNGDEDAAIPLSITADSVDNQVPETIEVVLSGVPSGATLSAGTDNGDGTVTLTPAELMNLTITPPADSDVDFDLTVAATATETDDPSRQATSTDTIRVTVNPVADPVVLPDLTAGGTDTDTDNENTPIELMIDSALTAALSDSDTDGSESISSVVISGVPADAPLSAGTNNNDGSYTLTEAQLNGLTMTITDGGHNPSTIVTLMVTVNTIDTDTEGRIDVDTGLPITNTSSTTSDLEVGVDNTPPMVDSISVVGGGGQTVAGFDVEFDVTVSDANPNDDPFTLNIDWGDGSSGTFVLGVDPITHAFENFGELTVTVTATDVDGEEGPAETTTINVVPVAVIDGDIYAGGTGNSDRIIYSASNSGVTVRFNNTFFGPFFINSDTRLVAFGQGGNDQIIVSGDIGAPAVFDGGEGNDYLGGQGLDDTLIGGAGNDVVLGGEGDNLLIGDDREGVVLAGSDRLEGRSGVDHIFGGGGNDRINGGAGDDVLDGGEGNDFVFGNLGNDFLHGGDGADTLNGHFGNDVIFGGGSSDQMFGGSDQDLLVGGESRDRLRGDSGDDDLVGGTSGLDSQIEAALDAILQSMATPQLTLADTDPAVDDAINDWISGNDRSGFMGFSGGDGADDLTGGSGADEFHDAGDGIRDQRDGEGTF